MPKYKSERRPDGTFTLRSVPVFGNVKAGEHPQVPFDLPDTWVKAAFSTSVVQASKYRMPLHVGHTSKGPTERAGFVEPRAVQPMYEADGTLRTTIVADFVGVPPEMHEAIQSGKLSYCSAEIRSFFPPEIGSVALIEEAPHFKYGEIGVAEFSASPVQVYFNHTSLSPTQASEDAMELTPELKKYIDEQIAKGVEAGVAKELEAFEDHLADVFGEEIGDDDESTSPAVESETPVDTGLEGQAVAGFSAEGTAMLAFMKKHVETTEAALNEIREQVSALVAKDKGAEFSAQVAATKRRLGVNDSSLDEKLMAAAKAGTLATVEATFAAIGAGDPPAGIEALDEKGKAEFQAQLDADPQVAQTRLAEFNALQAKGFIPAGMGLSEYLESTKILTAQRRA